MKIHFLMHYFFFCKINHKKSEVKWGKKKTYEKESCLKISMKIFANFINSVLKVTKQQKIWKKKKQFFVDVGVFFFCFLLLFILYSTTQINYFIFPFFLKL